MEGMIFLSSYYTTLVIITITAMIVSIIHLFENQTLHRRVKHQLIFVSSLIILGITCEFLGIYLNNIPSANISIFHSCIKAIEFTVTPIIPASYITIIDYKNHKKFSNFFMILLLIINTFLEFININMPFIFYIDENNIYKHGSCYFIYIFIYSIEIAIFIFELLRHTKKYQVRNIATLISILAFLLIGLSVRLIDSAIYTDWLIVAITYLLFVIYYSDLSLKVDPLTDLLNRKSYEYKLKKLDYTTAIILLDVDQFKQTNDKYGHQAGDNLLKLISRTIIKAYGKYGYCYRIGGDEFCVILKSKVIENFLNKNPSATYSDFLDDLNKNFDDLLLTYYEKHPSLKSSVSKGYSIFYGTNNYENSYKYSSSVEKAIKLADEKMYENKKGK